MSKARIVEAVELGSRTSPRRSPLSLLTHVEVGGLSHVGRVRETNEDHFLVARFDRQMSALLTNLPTLIPDRYADAMDSQADGRGTRAERSHKRPSARSELVVNTPDWTAHRRKLIP